MTAMPLTTPRAPRRLKARINQRALTTEGVFSLKISTVRCSSGRSCLEPDSAAERADSAGGAKARDAPAAGGESATVSAIPSAACAEGLAALVGFGAISFLGLTV